MSRAAGYSRRGLRQIGPALPVDLVVEFDRRVNEHRLRSGTSMITEALRLFMECPCADWEAGDHRPSGDA